MSSDAVKPKETTETTDYTRLTQKRKPVLRKKMKPF